VLLVATGPEKLPVFHSGGFLPLYISTTDEEAKALHEAHSNSLLFTPGNLSNLPFADFQIDIVVVDLSRFPRDLVGPVVTDAVRILMQKGVLFLLGAANNFELSNLPLANKLLELGFYENSFVRRLGMAPDVPVCEDCEFERLGCGVNGSRILDSNVKHGCKMTTVQCSNHQFRRSLIPIPALALKSSAIVIGGVET